MITIGFDGSRAFSKEKTGTENYSYQLLKTLSKIDKKNHYIVYTRQNDNAGPAVQALSNFPKNFKFRKINWPRLWTQAGLASQTFKDPLDVLFIPAHTSPLIHKRGLKTVITVHDLGAEYLPKMHQLKQQLYLKWITKYQLNSAAKLIAVSKATKEDLVKKIGINSDKITVVYEGYDQRLYKPVKADVLINTLSHYELFTNNYFLFVGTIQPRKNLERIIKAFAIHLRGVKAHLGGGIKLVIVGQKGWMSEDIYKLPKKLGIQDRVKFLGYVHDQDMAALYSGATALIFPSLFEGFGLPILEAQACACPVLTSNTSSMPEIAGKGALYVDPYSMDSIKNGMVKIRNRDLRSRLVELGYENVKKFSWEKCAEETLKVLMSS